MPAMGVAAAIVPRASKALASATDRRFMLPIFLG